MDNFAMCGTVSQPLSTGVVVTETDHVQVTLAGQGEGPGTVPQVKLIEGGPAFQVPYGITRTPNSFGIKTGDWSSMQYKDKIWYGLGKYDTNNNIVPVACFPAMPNQEYILQPVVVFYVGTGKYEQGTAANITQIGQIATIDFTKAHSGQTIATIIHKDNKTFSDPVLSYRPDKNGDPRLPDEDEDSKSI